jgi:amino acid transporter
MEQNIQGRRKRPKLRKELTFAQLILIGVVGSLGNGALFGTIEMVAGAGPGAIIGFIFGAIIYSFLGLTYMELSRVYPEAGGPTRYTIYTHGRWTNMINAMADIVWYLFIPPVEVVAILLGFNYFDPIFMTSAGAPTYYGVLAGVALLLAFVPFNYFGIKQFGKSTLITGLVKLFFYLSLVIGLIAVVFNYKDLYAYNGVLPYGGTAIFAIMPFAMYDFGATRVIPDLAEEAKLKDKVPKAIFLTIIIESLIYIGVAVAILMGTNWSALGTPVGHFSALTAKGSTLNGQNPFFVFSKDSGSFYVFIAAVVTGLLAPFVTGYIYLGSGTRVLFSMGRSGYIHKSLKNINPKHAIPVVSLVIFAIVGAIVVFVAAPVPSIYTFIDDATAAGYIGLVSTPVALMVTRRQGITQDKDKVRGMWFFAPAAMGLGSLIVFWTGFTSLSYAVILIAAGSIIFGAISRVKIGAKNAIWYVLYIAFALFMTATSNDGLKASQFPQIFSYLEGTIIVLIVTIAVFYPWGILSGFKEQFSHKEWTDPYKNMATEGTPAEMPLDSVAEKQ